MTEANFINQEDALEMLGRSDVCFVDGSWYLPAQGRDGFAEYRTMRIPGAVYFDINKIADRETSLPHMLPSPEQFAQEVSMLGISNDDLIIVYDGPGLFSAPRVWWTFKTMGALDVRILQGGMDEWKAADLPVETGNPNPPLAKIFSAAFDPGRVVSQQDIEQHIAKIPLVILDARPEARFYGEAPEPRPGLRGGHIPGSTSLPSSKLIKNGQLLPTAELEKIFTSLGIEQNTKVITSCGSGVTAAILTLALAETGRKNTSLYDGSWAQWGLPDGPEIETDASE